MASETAICNMAISHLGVGKEIANIDTEQSEEASACRRFFDTARDATLRDFPWPFATKQVALSLIETFTAGEWTYSYRYPSDCVKAKRILSGDRNDNHQSRVPYKILKDGAARIIYTDTADAELEYTERVEDTSYWPPDFELAFSFRLAAYIAPRLAKGDPFNLRKEAMAMYDLELSRAKAASINEEQTDELPDSEFVRVRS